MSTFGIDYAWGRPGVTALRAAEAMYVCRYLSHDTTGKNLTRAEAHTLSAAGIWIVVVWEGAADRALGGRAAGVADARDAEAQATACGMPPGRPIYFAVDWDASASQQAAINSYLDGAASVLGRERVGLYGGYGPVKRAFDAGKITYGWQTYAWSGGRWDSRAQLQQYSNDHRFGGVGCDYDRAVKADYGQWKVGVSPVPAPAPQEEDDVPEYVSLGMSKPQAAKGGAKTRVTFDKEYADTGDSHADGAYPGILSGGKNGTQFIAQVTISPPTPWRLIETDPANDYETSKSYETHGDASGVVTGWCNKGQHLYVEVEPAQDATVNVAVKAQYWTR